MFNKPVNLIVATMGACLNCVLLGCHAAPLTYDAADLQSPKARARVAHLYWQRNNVPDIQPRDHRRMALLDFSVEFITGKVEMPGQTQPSFTPPAIAPAHVGVEYSGLFRKQYEFDKQLCRQVTDELYQIFLATMAEQGFEVLPNAAVQAATSFAKLDSRERDDGSFFQEMNFIGSDTGRIKQMITVPAEGMQIVIGAAKGDIESVELALLDELDADISIRAHFRIGVYQGRASIDRGSVIWVLTRDLVGNLTADRSLISETPVATSRGFVPLQGKIFEINSEDYLAAMRQLFPPYLGMALGN